MNMKVLYQWKNELASHFKRLNSWQGENVTLLSDGIVGAESCQQGAVARAVSCGEKVDSTSRRGRGFLDNPGFRLEAFFKEWGKWVVEGLGLQEIRLWVDEPKWHDRMAVMLVGQAWEGRCIPLVWRSYPANDAAGYPAEGQVQLINQLLQQVQAALPSTTQVLVLADRGMGTSPDLCKVVDRLGWRYLFRVTCPTKLVTADGDFTIAQQVQAGDIWGMSGTVFKHRGRIPAYARAIWSVGYDQAWALVTNDEQITGSEYARRNWQEQSFRDLKSGGWRWGERHVSRADHSQRLWVLLARAYAFVLALGSQAVVCQQVHPLQHHADGRISRHFSLFREGLTYFVEVIQRYALCPRLVFIPHSRLL
jgi:hypothetical protein